MSRTKRVIRERSTGVSERLAELQKEFETHRANTPVACGRRYPLELQQKVLAALEGEIPRKAIMSACRITTNHIHRWQGGHGLAKQRGIARTAPARVFNVVQHHPEERLRVEGEEIEIRIGRWQLQLRLDQASPDRG